MITNLINRCGNSEVLANIKLSKNRDEKYSGSHERVVKAYQDLDYQV